MLPMLDSSIISIDAHYRRGCAVSGHGISGTDVVKGREGVDWSRDATLYCFDQW